MFFYKYLTINYIAPMKISVGLGGRKVFRFIPKPFSFSNFFIRRISVSFFGYFNMIVKLMSYNF